MEGDHSSIYGRMVQICAILEAFYWLFRRDSDPLDCRYVAALPKNKFDLTWKLVLVCCNHLSMIAILEVKEAGFLIWAHARKSFRGSLVP